MIKELASLKTGITRALVKSEIQKLNSLGINSKKLKESNYYHILDKRNTKKMATVLYELWWDAHDLSLLSQGNYLQADS